MSTWDDNIKKVPKDTSFDFHLILILQHRNKSGIFLKYSCSFC
jgi:hypothetical protein